MRLLTVSCSIPQIQKDWAFVVGCFEPNAKHFEHQIQKYWVLIVVEPHAETCNDPHIDSWIQNMNGMNL